MAVQPPLFPPPAPTDSMLIETPQTLAATVIGICAFTGMFALSTWRSRARLLRTFDRLTLTSEVATVPRLDAPEATVLPANGDYDSPELARFVDSVSFFTVRAPDDAIELPASPK